jgi:hypothetical protein
MTVVLSVGLGVTGGLSVFFAEKIAIDDEPKHATPEHSPKDDVCLDSMKMITTYVANEQATCERPDQRIEVWPAGTANSRTLTLVKCICQRPTAGR